MKFQYIYMQAVVMLLLRYNGFTQVSNFSITYNPPGRVAVDWFYERDSTIRAYIIERRETGAEDFDKLVGDSIQHTVFLARNNTGVDVTWTIVNGDGFRGVCFYYMYMFKRIAYIEATGANWIRYFDMVGHIGDFEYRLVKMTTQWKQLACSDTLTIRYAVFLPTLTVDELESHKVLTIKNVSPSNVFAITVH